MEKVKLSKEEKIKIVAKQKASNIPQRKWCDANNVNFHSFKSWIKFYNEKTNLDSTSNWIKAIPSKTSIIGTQTAVIKITTGNVTIEIENDFHEEVLSKILKVVKNNA